MKCMVVSLAESHERRKHIRHEFDKVGLDFEFWPAVSRFELTEKHRALVDDERRRRLGMAEFDDGSIACLVSHLSLLRFFLELDDDMIVVFEDDVRLHPDIVAILDGLSGRAENFDVVKLQRRNDRKRFYPIYQLLPGYNLGRVKFHDYGGYGYVITRQAAAHLLSFKRFHQEIDQLISRFWDTGLEQVLYVDPPVVFHDDTFPSYIESGGGGPRQCAVRA